MTIEAGAWGHRNAEPCWKAEAGLQQIAVFEPKAFVPSSQDRLVLPLKRPWSRNRGTAQSGGERSLVKTYLNDPLGLEATVPRLNLAASEMAIKPLRFLAQPREAHCGS